jgi:hypothetical protein
LDVFGRQTFVLAEAQQVEAATGRSNAELERQALYELGERGPPPAALQERCGRRTIEIALGGNGLATG